MAICKILSLKDSMNNCAGHHLMRALEYIINGEKTEEQLLVGAVNVSPQNAFEQMRETKEYFGKNGGRQGYHIIISFQTAYEIAGKFVQEYFGKDYEVVYSVHNNTDHIHIHVIWNSVNFVTGKKYRYEKGDWERTIMPIVNRLCEEHGLSTLDTKKAREEGSRQTRGDYEYRRYGEWSDMIRRDLDITIAKADSFEEFLADMQGHGYEIKKDKMYLAMRPPGMTRWRRMKTLGEDYTEERIRERIREENLATYQMEAFEESERIVYSKIPRGKRAKLTPVQKRYYARLYRIGMLMRRPYSKVWKYKKDIKTFYALQEQYLFLIEHETESLGQLKQQYEALEVQKQKIGREKSRLYREQKKSGDLFHLAEQAAELFEMEKLYQNGEAEFAEEHRQWEALQEKLAGQGYKVEDVLAMKKHYENEIKKYQNEEKKVRKELKAAQAIIAEVEAEAKNLERPALSELEEERKEQGMPEEWNEHDVSKKQTVHDVAEEQNGQQGKPEQEGKPEANRTEEHEAGKPGYESGRNIRR